jgi:aryl-phospho-beta-D-glucosidase BglC (GH1 family)
MAFAQLSKISVVKNHFVTSEGKICIMKGLNSSDPYKLEQEGQWNKHYFEMIKSWGANCVRIPIHPASWRSLGKENYLKLLDQGVVWAEEEGLYVILDWHSIGNLIEKIFFPGYSPT